MSEYNSIVSSSEEDKTSERMRKVRSENTAPEVILRKALWKKGIRYRVAPKDIAGKPDIAITSKRVAIFIDGDFWHGNQWRKRGLTSLEDQFKKSKSKNYWSKKIRGNIERDCKNVNSLLEEGWKVIRFWESDIYEDLESCLGLVLSAINGRHKSEKKMNASLLPEKSFADFFAGIGLMRLALEKQGWSIKFANDIDPDKYKMYKSNFKDADGHYLLMDIHKLEASQIPNITLATASFPCNDLSLAGSRSGLVGKQSSALWGFIKLINEMQERRPPIILLENVTGFLTSQKGKDFSLALKTLNELGYLVDAFLINAVNFVPQSRPRLFVVGIRSDRYIHKTTSHVYEIHPLRPKMLTQFIYAHPEVRWAIRSIPAPPRPTTKLADILDDIPHNSDEWWSVERAEYLLNQMSDPHRKIAEQMIQGPRWSYGTIFRRMRNGKSMAELRIDGIAGCLRTPRGGSARQILFKAGGGEYHVRLLTPKECARLMGANNYKTEMPLNQSLFGFGDAVCVPVIEWIAKHYFNPVVNELIRGELLQRV